MDANDVWRNEFLLYLFVAMIASACAAAVPEQPTLTQTAMPSATPVPSTPTPVPTTPTPVPSLPPGVNNVVYVAFNSNAQYASPGDTFVNHEVTGFAGPDTHLENSPDSSHAPVYGLGLEFSSEVGRMEAIGEEDFVSYEPPIYRWFFGDVPEEPMRELYRAEAGVEPRNMPIVFTPGFDVSISMDKTSFSELDYQVVTITLVPRQTITQPGFVAHFQGGYYGDSADVEVIDLPIGENRGPQGEIIYVEADKKNITVTDLPLTINEPYIFTMTLKVDPNRSSVVYKPYMAFNWIPQETTVFGKSVNGTTQGNTISWTVRNVGTWTWHAAGEYTWNWGVASVYSVIFH